ncbi:MAG TPA: bacterio-opsin activator domain-containing protein [Halobacteriales archaeon]|nr:bacterio-opsin activator domain-containing protein [Halobacteriales archaeon]
MDRLTPEDPDAVDRENVSDGVAFQALFQESFDAIVIADDEGRYVEANPAACELFGLPREELLGRSIADFAEEGFDFEDAWRAFSEGKNERGLFPLVRADGERRTVEYSATREILPDRHLSILRDVTEREENERRIRRQRDELETLNRINELVRETIDGVVESRTRATIERTVCTTIAESDLYSFALVGESDRQNGGLAVRASEGVDDDWIERLYRLDTSAANEGPGVRAMQTDAVQLLDADDLASLPEQASEILDDSGARSLLVAPIMFGAVGHGFLAVGANRDEAFGDREIEGFSALTNAIGFAINAVESKQSLSAETTTVLELDVVDPGSSLGRLAEPGGGTISVEALLPLDDASSLVYARTTGRSVDHVRSRAEEVAEVERFRVVEQSEDGSLVEVVEERRTPVHVLRELGARVRDMAVDDDGTWHIAVAVPPDRDVRSVVEALEEGYPAVTLRSKGVAGESSRSRPGREPFEGLTDRQRTVLEAAYQSGYYDWPRRGRSAEELAEPLGIAPQTVLEHLRKAERVVMDGYFDAR